MAATPLPVLCGAAFLCAAALTMTARVLWPHEAGHASSARVRPHRASAPTGAKPAAPAVDPAELWSVRHGYVVLSGAPISEDFAVAWRRLFAAIHDDMKAGRTSRETEAARQLFADWLKVDADGAVQFVSAEPGLLGHRGGAFLLPLLAETDVAMAWRMTENAADGTEARRLRIECMKAAARMDAAKALAFAATLQGPAQADAEKAILTEWSARHGAEAAAWCVAQPAGSRRERLFASVLDSWLRADAGEAVNFMEGRPAPAWLRARWGAPVQERHNEPALLARYYSNTNSENMGRLAEQIREAAKQRDLDSPMSGCTALVAAAHDPGAEARRVYAVLRGMPGLERALWQGILQNGLPPLKELEGMVRAMPPEMTGALPSAALQFKVSETLPVIAALGADILQSYAGATLDVHPPIMAGEVLAGILALPPETQGRHEAMQRLLEAACRTAPAVVLDALAEVPVTANQRSNIVASAARQLAETDPVRALQSVGSLPEALPELVSVILARGAGVNPQAVAAMLSQVDLPVNDYVAAESFTRGWAAADDVAASAWVHDLPAGELRDGGAAGLARTIATRDPEAGFLWGLEISSDDVRRRVLKTIVRAAGARQPPVSGLLDHPRLPAADRAWLLSNR